MHKIASSGTHTSLDQDGIKKLDRFNSFTSNLYRLLFSIWKIKELLIHINLLRVQRRGIKQYRFAFLSWFWLWKDIKYLMICFYRIDKLRILHFTIVCEFFRLGGQQGGNEYKFEKRSRWNSTCSFYEKHDAT